MLEHSASQRLLTPAEGQLTIYGHPFASQRPSDVQLIVLSNLPKAIRQLGQPDSENGPQLDAIFGPTPIFEAAIRFDLPVKLAPEIGEIGVQPLVIATVPQDGLKVDRLISEINKTLARLQRHGHLAEVYLRWYGRDLSQPP